MKVEKFCFGNGVEVLTDNELKATRGGYGPANWAECCFCHYYIDDVEDVGWVCGNYGDSDCSKGMSSLEEFAQIIECY